jgi:hypothetical protein
MQGELADRTHARSRHLHSGVFECSAAMADFVRDMTLCDRFCRVALNGRYDYSRVQQQPAPGSDRDRQRASLANRTIGVCSVMHTFAYAGSLLLRGTFGLRLTGEQLARNKLNEIINHGWESACLIRPTVSSRALTRIAGR